MVFDVNEISSILKERLKKNSVVSYEEIGVVIQVGDNVAQVYGLEKVRCGELVEFEGGQIGLALNLEEYSVGVIIFGDSTGIKEGTKVKRTYKKASINVGEGFVGRVVDSLGNPIDGKGKISGETFEMPLERKAPGVLFRQPVSEPLQTGIKSIDAMIPIGCGQRELIIGDRQTGKTTIALDTIINQRHFYENGNPIYCIYVAIGQKASTVTSLVNILEKHDALKYTSIVSATASCSPSMQYYAPFAGAAIGEFFRDTGRRALVIYDDLSKHAVAYREISLLLERSPGREAYPGDVFYLHSRLLERSAKINNNDEIAKQMNDIPESIKHLIKGGGSLTALPIIETQGGNMSDFISTNVISITDGQIVLDTDLFNSGFRPAINVGLSVSRVGSSAQLKPMKKVAGKLKLSQSQFTELASFSKFGSDLDQKTQEILDKGMKNNEILKQKNNNPLTVGEQVIIIYAAINGFFSNVNLNEIKIVEEKLLKIINLKYKNIIDDLNNGIFNEEIETKIIEICKQITNINR